MKKFLILMLVASLFLTIVAADTVRLVRLTIVNKSGYQAFINLNGVDLGQQYYLTIPKGTKDYPETNVYTILPDVYKWNITYSLVDGDLVIPIGEEYRELNIFGQLKVNLLAPTFYYNNCDEDSESLSALFSNPNCKVDYFRGEENNLKFVPLGFWNFRY